MAEGTPRRGNTIAEKIALFRAAGASASPQRTAQEEAFWWQKPSATRSDETASLPARPDRLSQLPPRSPGPAPQTSTQPKQRTLQHESDARYRSADQGLHHATPRRPATPSAVALPPAPPAGATAAALQRLAHEHPSLYNAVLSLERGDDGRLSDAAVQLVNQALARSTAAASTAAAQAPPSAHAAGHTTTTIVPQASEAQPPRHWQGSQAAEVQARAQAALAAAAAAGAKGDAPGRPRSRDEESMDQLLARYRRGDHKSDAAVSVVAPNTAAPAPATAPVIRPGARPSPKAAPITTGPISVSRGTPRSSLQASETRPVSAAQAPPANRQQRQGPVPADPQSTVTEAGASVGASEVAVAAAAAVAAPAPVAGRSRWPSPEKLEKILRLAQMANRLSGSPPEARPAGHSGPEAADGPSAVGQASASRSPADSELQPQASATGPEGASRSSLSSSGGGDLASEPSLSVLQAHAAAGGARGSARGVTAGGEPAQAGAAPPIGQAAPPEGTLAGVTDARGAAVPASSGPAPPEPPGQAPSGSSVITAANGGSSGGAAHATGPGNDSDGGGCVATPSAAAAGIDVGAALAASDSASAPAAAEHAEPSPSGSSFAFPVTMGTAGGSAAALMRGAALEPAAAAAARRVQFSPNEPQVRLYSESGAAPPVAAVSGTPVPGRPAPPGAMQPVFLLPSPTPPDDPNAPRPTHIFVPANPSLPPALVAVPGFEPPPPWSVSPPSPSRRRRQSQGGSSVSPPRRSRQNSTSPPKRDRAPAAHSPATSAAAATESPAAAAGGAGGSGAPASTAAAATSKQRSEVDRVLDSDSDSDTDPVDSRRVPPDVALEMKAAEQAAAQVERESTVHTPNRLTRLLDQVAAFRRTEGERLLREGERLKMVEELKSMSIDQLAALLGPTSELLKEISRFRDLTHGNLELVKAAADEHTRTVLDALQQTADTAQAVKQAVVESALQQQDEVLQLVDSLVPPAPPPPPLRSALLALPSQKLYGAAPATSDLLNPTWWTQLLDPMHRESLAGSVAAAAGFKAGAGGQGEAADAAAAAAAAGEPWRPQAAAGDLLAQQVTGLASAIRASLDHPAGAGAVGLGGGGGGEEDMDLSVSAITRAARQVSLTLDMAVREYIDRTTQATSTTLVTAPALAIVSGSQALSPAALSPGTLLPGNLPPGFGTTAADAGHASDWVAQPVVLPPVVMLDGTVVQQPLTATTVLPPPPAAAAPPANVVYALQPALHPLPPAPAELQQSGPQLPCSGLAALGHPPQPAATAAVQGVLLPAAAMVPPPPHNHRQQQQLVAVYGALPASGASGTALLNLPMCGPAMEAGVAGGGATSQQVQVQVHPQASPCGFGGAAAVRVPAAQGASMQPGEGLPCRMDLHVVQLLPVQHSQQQQQQQLGQPLQQPHGWQEQHHLYHHQQQQQPWQQQQAGPLPWEDQHPLPTHPRPHLEHTVQSSATSGHGDASGAYSSGSLSRPWATGGVPTDAGCSQVASNTGGRDGGIYGGRYGGGYPHDAPPEPGGLATDLCGEEKRSGVQPTVTPLVTVVGMVRGTSPGLSSASSPSTGSPPQSDRSASRHSTIGRQEHGRSPGGGGGSRSRRRISSSSGRAADADSHRGAPTAQSALGSSQRDGVGSLDGSRSTAYDSTGSEGVLESGRRGCSPASSTWCNRGGFEAAPQHRLVDARDDDGVGNGGDGRSVDDRQSRRSSCRSSRAVVGNVASQARHRPFGGGGGDVGDGEGGGSSLSSSGSVGQGSSAVFSVASLAAGVGELTLATPSATPPVPYLQTRAQAHGGAGAPSPQPRAAVQDAGRAPSAQGGPRAQQYDNSTAPRPLAARPLFSPPGSEGASLAFHQQAQLSALGQGQSGGSSSGGVVPHYRTAAADWRVPGSLAPGHAAATVVPAAAAQWTHAALAATGAPAAGAAATPTASHVAALQGLGTARAAAPALPVSLYAPSPHPQPTGYGYGHVYGYTDQRHRDAHLGVQRDSELRPPSRSPEQPQQLPPPPQQLECAQQPRPGACLAPPPASPSPAAAARQASALSLTPGSPMLGPLPAGSPAAAAAAGPSHYHHKDHHHHQQQQQRQTDHQQSGPQRRVLHTHILQPPAMSTPGQPTSQRLQQQQWHQQQPQPATLQAPKVPPPPPVFPAAPVSAGRSEEVQRAYRATLAQLQAVYRGHSQG